VEEKFKFFENRDLTTIKKENVKLKEARKQHSEKANGNWKRCSEKVKSVYETKI
jgi:hypothetical protein